MSRSYKHTPGFCDRNPWAKKQASRRIRRMKEVPNGGAYKKFYESWDIHDYKCLYHSKRELEESVWLFASDKKYRAYMK